MIDPKEIQLNYMKKERLNGSDRGMRYRLEQKQDKDAEELAVTVWPEPFCFFKTPPEKKTAAGFPFSQEGLLAAIDWMKEQQQTNPLLTRQPAE